MINNILSQYIFHNLLMAPNKGVLKVLLTCLPKNDSLEAQQQEQSITYLKKYPNKVRMTTGTVHLQLNNAVMLYAMASYQQHRCTLL